MSLHTQNLLNIYLRENRYNKPMIIEKFLLYEKTTCIPNNEFTVYFRA